MQPDQLNTRTQDKLTQLCTLCLGMASTREFKFLPLELSRRLGDTLEAHHVGSVDQLLRQRVGRDETKQVKLCLWSTRK